MDESLRRITFEYGHDAYLDHQLITLDDLLSPVEQMTFSIVYEAMCWTITGTINPATEEIDNGDGTGTPGSKASVDFDEIVWKNTDFIKMLNQSTIEEMEIIILDSYL